MAATIKTGHMTDYFLSFSCSRQGEIVLVGVGMYLTLIQTDVAQLQYAHRLGYQQDLDEQFLQLPQILPAEVGNGFVCGEVHFSDKLLAN